MKQSTAIRKARDYVRLSPMGDQWTMIYSPMPGDPETATRGGMLSWPWQQARSKLSTTRARIALELMGYDADQVDDGVFHATESVYGRNATRIDEIVDDAVEYLEARK